MPWFVWPSQTDIQHRSWKHSTASRGSCCSSTSCNSSCSRTRPSRCRWDIPHTSSLCSRAWRRWSTSDDIPCCRSSLRWDIPHTDRSGSSLSCSSADRTLRSPLRYTVHRHCLRYRMGDLCTCLHKWRIAGWFPDTPHTCVAYSMAFLGFLQRMCCRASEWWFRWHTPYKRSLCRGVRHSIGCLRDSTSRGTAHTCSPHSAGSWG